MTPYLYRHENPHAPKRDNGRRFWGYPGRSEKIRLIGVHTCENLFDLIGEDTGAEGVARFQSQTERPSSYNRIVDRDSTVVCLPNQATAFGIGDLNSPTLHIAFALRAADWSDPRKAKAARPMLERGAAVCAEWCQEFGIPLTWLARDAAFGRSRGFIRHGTADPTRRSDPGRDFPAGLFFELIAARLDGKPAPKPPAPPAPVVVQEDRVYIVTKNPTPGQAPLDWGSDGTSKFEFESQEAKNGWASVFGAVRKDLPLEVFDAIPTVARAQ